MSNPRYGSGRRQFVGQGVDVDLTRLDPAAYTGAVAYSDGQLYFSDGSGWVIPQDKIDIARPRGLVPTNSLEQTQLRLSAFSSPTGETQTGIIFEINTDGVPDFALTANVVTRTVTSTVASLYQLLYPEDGFEPGDIVWWRARYLGTGGTQSEFSTPIAQTYPNLVDDPVAVTRSGAVSGTVQISPFFSAFGLQYVNTQFQFWDEGDDPETDPPLESVTTPLGATIALPAGLPEGGNYLWRARYGANLTGVGSPTVFSAYTFPRVVNKGAGSMRLIYDPALAPSRTINLPLGVYGGVVNVTVDWGDGTSNAYTTGGIRSKTYGAGVTGLVTVTISGQLEQFGGNTNIQGLVRVDNIGFNLGLTSLREMFRNVTSNTTFCTPNLPPTVKSIRGMFRSAGAGAPGFAVQSLVVSDVEDFSECFLDASTFNQPLAEWDTSSATTMSQMFRGAGMAFNQPIGGWDVSNVTDMSYMFARTNRDHPHAFNQNIGAWDVSKVTTMEYMFARVLSAGGAAVLHSFNNGGSDSIKNWDTSSCVNFGSMFHTAGFAQPIAPWDVSSGLNFAEMFSDSSFNQPLAGWNLSAATSVSLMFSRSSFSADVSGWTLPTNITALFAGSNFNHASIVGWDTSGVTNMSNLFSDAYAFNQPIGVWDVSSVTDMSGMFQGGDARHNFNQPLNSWDVSKVTNMSNMFRKTASSVSDRFNSFNQPLDLWDVSSVVDMSGMFASLSNQVSQVRFNQDISMWRLNPSGVSLVDFMASNRSGGTGIDFSTENYSKLLAGWANTVTEQNGPFGVSANFSTETYNSTVYFSGELYETAVAGRAYFTNSNRLTVSGASTADADGTYLFNAGLQLYVRANDWYFFKAGGVWQLRDDDDVVQATQQDSANLAAPQLVQTWDGVLAAATVRRTGASWTIIDGGLV
jgi:surface protein